MFVLLPPRLAISKLTTLSGIGPTMQMRSTTRFTAGGPLAIVAGCAAIAGGQSSGRMPYLLVICLVTTYLWTALRLRDTVKAPNGQQNLGRCDTYVGAGFVAVGARSNDSRILKAVRK